VSTNPNRVKLMSPIDYLAALAGYMPPDPMEQAQQQMQPFIDAQYQVNPYQPRPTPQPQRNVVPAIPLSALRGR